MKRSYFNRWCILKHIIASIRFNFHYLPFRQAIHLPFVFMAPVRFYSKGGKVMITGPIRHAMISLGLPGNDVFDRQEPFIWNVEGGVCHFQGSCAINPGSSITLRKGAYLLFGDRVSMGQHTKIICHKKIVIGHQSLISWNCTLMDSDAHPFYDLEQQCLISNSESIAIGCRTFIGQRSTILKGAFCLIIPASHQIVF